MASVFGRSDRGFSIDDAFEEDNDELIKVYGSTTERSPLKPKNRNVISDDEILVAIDDPSTHTQYTNLGSQSYSGMPSQLMKSKYTDDALSRDSDSLFYDNHSSTGIFDPNQWCCMHPKVKENWKIVLAAVMLLIVGIGLLLTGLVVSFLPSSNLQGFVFYIAGLICFIPGAYHVVYIYLAVKGCKGYDFYHLPLFN